MDTSIEKDAMNVSLREMMKPCGHVSFLQDGDVVNAEDLTILQTGLGIFI